MGRITAGALWLRARPKPPPATQSAALNASDRAQADVERVRSPPAPVTATAETAAKSSRPVPRHISAEQQQLRRRVVDALRAHEARGAIAPTAAHAEPGSTPTPTASHDGTMVDKTGELSSEELKVLNHELLPLIGD
jgi:hypothetical protein